MYTLFKEILFIFQTYKTIFYFIHIFYYKLSDAGLSDLAVKPPTLGGGYKANNTTHNDVYPT